MVSDGNVRMGVLRYGGDEVFGGVWTLKEDRWDGREDLAWLGAELSAAWGRGRERWVWEGERWRSQGGEWYEKLVMGGFQVVLFVGNFLIKSLESSSVAVNIYKELFRLVN